MKYLVNVFVHGKLLVMQECTTADQVDDTISKYQDQEGFSFTVWEKK